MVSSGEVRAEELQTRRTAPQLDPAHDVPPLIRAAHLQPASVTPTELHEVVRLQHHVVELQERERLLAIEALLHRLEAEHPVDGEVPAVLAQEGDVVERVEPLRVVGHQGRIIAEIQVALEYPPNAGDVGGDLLVGEKLPALVLAGRIAHLGGAAPHQRDGTMARALHVAQHHDLDEAPDVQRIGGRVEPDVSGDPSGCGGGVQRFEVGALVKEAAFDERPQELRAER